MLVLLSLSSLLPLCVCVCCLLSLKKLHSPVFILTFPCPIYLHSLMPLTSILYLSIYLASWADFITEYNVLISQHPIFTLTFGLVNSIVSLRLALIRKQHTVQINDVIILWNPVAISSTSWLLRFSSTSSFRNIVLSWVCLPSAVGLFLGLNHSLVSPAQCTDYQGAPRGGEVDLSVFTVEHMNTPYTPTGLKKIMIFFGIKKSDFYKFKSIFFYYFIFTFF